MKNEDDSELFHKELERQADQFEAFLQAKLKPRTIYRHVVVIGNLIEFLCFDCGVTQFKEIRRGMVCSSFRRWYCSNMQDRTESEVNTSVKKFFHFLVREQGVSVGKDVLVGLEITV
jgi:glutamate-1-semialdehyde aminotransferase